MKYFAPELALGALLPPQTEIMDKYGGLPWGLPVDRWPLCRECGKPLTHLATLTQYAERLDLGADGRAVLVFQCGRSPNETGCETLLPDSGANAVLFLDAKEQTKSLTEPPAPGAPREIEVRVTNWTEQHDLVTPELEPSFYITDSYDADGGFRDIFGEFYYAHEAVVDSVADGAKLGGVPGWIQSPEKIDSAFRFAAQLAMYLHFPDPLPSADAAQATINVRERVPSALARYSVSKPIHPDANLRGEIYVSDLTIKRYGSGFNVEVADFGDGGSGYLFVRPDPDAPQGLFLWQCG